MVPLPPKIANIIVQDAGDVEIYLLSASRNARRANQLRRVMRSFVQGLWVRFSKSTQCLTGLL